MKARLKGAQKGHSLLKKKVDALRMRFRTVLKKIIEVSKIEHPDIVMIFIYSYTSNNYKLYTIIINVYLNQRFLIINVNIKVKVNRCDVFI